MEEGDHVGIVGEVVEVEVVDRVVTLLLGLRVVEAGDGEV